MNNNTEPVMIYKKTNIALVQSADVVQSDDDDWEVIQMQKSNLRRKWRPYCRGARRS